MIEYFHSASGLLSNSGRVARFFFCKIDSTLIPVEQIRKDSFAKSRMIFANMGTCFLVDKEDEDRSYPAEDLYEVARNLV